MLKQVGFNTSGQYRCEVSAEGPDFNTVTGRGSLLVIGEWAEAREMYERMFFFFYLFM